VIASIAADSVLAIHFLFIVFAVLGGLLLLRYRWVIWLHVPAMIWAAMISFGGWICPLTPLENTLRRAAGEASYSGGFINRYLTSIIYPEGYTRELAVAAGVAVLVINTLIYGFVIYCKWKRRETI